MYVLYVISLNPKMYFHIAIVSRYSTHIQYAHSDKV